LAARTSLTRAIPVDRDDETRAHRLTTLRDQPELANPPMANSAAFLGREAQAVGCEI
jgi:hypothetical protein